MTHVHIPIRPREMRLKCVCENDESFPIGTLLAGSAGARIRAGSSILLPDGETPAKIEIKPA